jgi:hypothetical protein
VCAPYRNNGGSSHTLHSTCKYIVGVAASTPLSDNGVKNRIEQG